MWIVLWLLSVVMLFGGVALLIRAVRQRRGRKRTGLLAILLSPVVFVIAILTVPTDQTTPRQDTPAATPTTTPPVAETAPPPATPEPTVPDETPPTTESPFSQAAFERSTLFQANTLQEKDEWELKSGGRNYSYRFDHPTLPGESMGVEFRPAAQAFTEGSIRWPGDLPETVLDDGEARALRAFLAFIAPEADANAIVQYVRSQANTSYDGGSNEYPRKRFGAVDVLAGRTVELIVRVERRP